ncbi:MAG: hypothetical protein AAGA27_03835 [Pseudomonadota bacterium]
MKKIALSMLLFMLPGFTLADSSSNYEVFCPNSQIENPVLVVSQENGTAVAKKITFYAYNSNNPAERKASSNQNAGQNLLAYCNYVEGDNTGECVSGFLSIAGELFYLNELAKVTFNYATDAQGFAMCVYTVIDESGNEDTMKLTVYTPYEKVSQYRLNNAKTGFIITPSASY